MPTLRQRNGSWQAQVWVNGKQTAETFTTKKAALAWAYGLEAGDAKSSPALSDKPMAHFLKLYLREVVPTLSDPAKNESYIKFLLTQSWMDIPLNKLTSTHLTEWRDHRYLTCSAKTVHTNFTLFKTALSRVKQPVEMFDEIKLRPVLEREVPRLEEHDEERLMEAAEANKRAKYLKHLITIAVETAMRQGEMLKLERSHRDLNRGIIKLPARITKTGKPRQIPMSTRCEEAFVSVMDLDAKGELVFRKNPFFETTDGEKRAIPVTKDALRKTFETARAAAGLDHLHWHDLRHEACSRLFEKGLTVPEVQSISGHSTPDELSRYSHASAKAVMQKIRGQ